MWLPGRENDRCSEKERWWPSGPLPSRCGRNVWEAASGLTWAAKVVLGRGRVVVMGGGKCSAPSAAVWASALGAEGYVNFKCHSVTVEFKGGQR